MLLLGKTKKVFKLISKKSCDIQNSFEEVRWRGNYNILHNNFLRCDPVSPPWNFPYYTRQVKQRRSKRLMENKLGLAIKPI